MTAPFMTDEDSAISPLFFPNRYDLEARAEYRHYKEEEDGGQ